MANREAAQRGSRFAFDARNSLCLVCSSLLHSTLPSLFATRHSLFASSSRAPSRGACGAPVALRMPATHPDRPAFTRSRTTRVNALVTSGQTPHRSASPSRARLAFIAHPRLPLAAFDTPHIGPARPMGGEASCVTRRRVRSPLRRSTWDFWPGPVLAVICPAFAELRASPLG